MAQHAFSKFQKRAGGAKKILCQVTGVEDGVLKCVDEGGKAYNVMPKDDKGWPEDTAEGALILFSGFTEAGNGMVKPTFSEWIVRYPSIDNCVRVEAGGIATTRNGSPFVRLMKPSAAQKVTSVDQVADAVKTAMMEDFVPCRDSDRGIHIRFTDKEGKLQYVAAPDFVIGSTQVDGKYVDNDVNERLAAITEAIQGATEEVLSDGVDFIEIIPVVRMSGSMGMTQEKGGKARFANAAAQYETGRNEKNGREFINYGVQASVGCFKPRFDVNALKTELLKHIDKKMLGAFKVGENLNASQAASFLLEKGVDISQFQTGWYCNTLTPEAYPSPRPMSRVETPHLAPKWEKKQENEAGAEAEHSHQASAEEAPEAEIPADDMAGLDVDGLEADIDNLDLDDSEMTP